MEFADSAYGYFQQENFIGPSITFGYEIKNDSLILKSKWTDDYIWLIKKFGSDSLLVIEDGDILRCQRVDFEMSLKNFTPDKRNEYIDQYTALKKSFSCK